MGLSSRASLSLLLLIAAPCCVPAQTSPPVQVAKPARTARAFLEFPLRLKQKVVAGRTGVGTPVEGTLVMATLVNGTVVPENAVFTGVVEESVPHEDKKPSRLRVHITEAKWKDGHLSLDLYATGHEYPRFKPKPDPDEMRHRQGMLRLGTTEADEPIDPGAPTYDPRRLIDKDVKNERSTDGVIVVTSEKSNINLAGNGVYCFEGSTAK